MTNYLISGKFKPGFLWEKFAKTIESENEKNALEKVYSTMGSKHGLKRRSIVVESIQEV
ncbi:MAG: 50S ribosomal protein L18a [Methanosarcinales archaeon]|jgi:large subunit ribosomal protein LX|nr:50S ribosomal protein L18a [Methanosarcinales archaeon]